MLLVQKLYAKEFLKVLAILGIGISIIFSFIGLLEKIDELLLFKPPIGLLIEYTLLGIPKFVRYLLPMATLLSSLFIFSQAIKRMEIVTIKGAGGKMRGILSPFVVIGVLIALFGFVIGETIVPMSSKMMQSINNQITKKGKEFTFKEGTLFMRGRDGSVIRIGLYLPDKNICRDVSIFKFDSGGLREKIVAESAEWKGQSWMLKNLTVYDIRSGRATDLKEQVVTAIESPKIFHEDVWKVEEMTLLELIHYQQRLKEAGFKNTKLTVDISSRLSFPLVNLFLLLLGISLTLGDTSKKIFQRTMSGGVHANTGFVAAGLGLLVSLVYWFGHSFFLSLGYAGTIPPAAAPWIIPLMFAVVAVYLYRQIPE
ncbi:MAG: LptF/LptG family permease [Dissulfurispiraceae bacterium]